MTAEIPVELERRFNDLRREFLDLEIQAVHRWLTALAIFLTVLGVLLPIAAFFGFGRFREIEREAQAVLKEIKGHEQEAQQRVDRIMLNAEDAANNEMVVEEAQAATKAPSASLIDIAVAEALTLQKNKRIKEAIAKWNAIANLVQNTDSHQAARAHHSVGYLYATSGEEIENGSTSDDALRKAIRAFDEAIRLRPAHAPSHISRGITNIKLKQYEDAIADLDEAIRLQPDHAPSYYSRGLSNIKLKQYEDAIADLDEAIRLQPDHAPSYYSRGLSKRSLKQYEDAIADFDEAIRLQPDHANAYFSRGVSKHSLTQYKAAIADFDEAIRLQPDHTSSYQFRASAKAKLGQNDGAELDKAQAERLAAETDQSDNPSG